MGKFYKEEGEGVVSEAVAMVIPVKGKPVTILASEYDGEQLPSGWRYMETKPDPLEQISVRKLFQLRMESLDWLLRTEEQSNLDLNLELDELLDDSKEAALFIKNGSRLLFDLISSSEQKWLDTMTDFGVTIRELIIYKIEPYTVK